MPEDALSELSCNGRIAPVKVAPVMSALVRSAPVRVAEVRVARFRSAPLRSALVRFAPVRSVWFSFASCRSAPLKSTTTAPAWFRFASVRSAPLRFAPVRVAPTRSAPIRSAPLKFAPVRSCPLRFSPLRFCATSVSTSLALAVEPPSLELTVRVSRSVPEVVPAGATTTRNPRSVTGIAVIEVAVKDEPEAVSTTVQPEDSPVSVALVPSVSPTSEIAALSPFSVTLAPPMNSVPPLKTGGSATPAATSVTSAPLAVKMFPTASVKVSDVVAVPTLVSADRVAV